MSIHSKPPCAYSPLVLCGKRGSADLPVEPSDKSVKAGSGEQPYDSAFEKAWDHVKDFVLGTRCVEARNHLFEVRKDGNTAEVKCWNFLAALGMMGPAQWSRFQVERSDDPDMAKIHVEGTGVSAMVPWSTLTQMTGYDRDLAPARSFASFVESRAAQSEFDAHDQTTNLAEHLNGQRPRSLVQQVLQTPSHAGEFPSMWTAFSTWVPLTAQPEASVYLADFRSPAAEPMQIRDSFDRLKELAFAKDKDKFHCLKQANGTELLVIEGIFRRTVA